MGALGTHGAALAATMDLVNAKANASEESDRSSGKSGELRLIVMGIAAILLIWFALANFRSVKIDFWLDQRQAPLIVVILISGLLGALIATLALRRRSNRD